MSDDQSLSTVQVYNDCVFVCVQWRRSSVWVRSTRMSCLELRTGTLLPRKPRKIRRSRRRLVFACLSWTCLSRWSWRERCPFHVSLTGQFSVGMYRISSSGSQDMRPFLQILLLVRLQCGQNGTSYRIFQPESARSFWPVVNLTTGYCEHFRCEQRMSCI